MSGCRGRLRFTNSHFVVLQWTLAMNMFSGGSSQGFSALLKGTLRKVHGKTRRNMPSRQVFVYCFVFIEICSQLPGQHPQASNMVKTYGPFSRKVLEQCWLLLSDVLKPNSTILCDFGTRHCCFVFPATYFQKQAHCWNIHLFFFFFF